MYTIKPLPEMKKRQMDPIGSGGFLQMNAQLPKHIVCLFKQKN